MLSTVLNDYLNQGHFLPVQLKPAGSQRPSWLSLPLWLSSLDGKLIDSLLMMHTWLLKEGIIVPISNGAGMEWR